VVNNSPTEESRGRRDIQNAMIQENKTIECNFPAYAMDASLSVHQSIVAVHQVDFEIPVEYLCNFVENVRAISIIRIQPPNNVAACKRKSLIQCVCLAAIGFG